MSAAHEYARYRQSLLARIFNEALTPKQVAMDLQEHAEEHTFITYNEIRSLLEMGDTWRLRHEA